MCYREKPGKGLRGFDFNNLDFLCGHLQYIIILSWSPRHNQMFCFSRTQSGIGVIVMFIIAIMLYIYICQLQDLRKLSSMFLLLATPLKWDLSPLIFLFFFLLLPNFLHLSFNLRLRILKQNAVSFPLVFSLSSSSHLGFSLATR